MQAAKKGMVLTCLKFGSNWDMMVPKMQKFSRLGLRIQAIQASTCRKFVSWGEMVGVIL